MKNLYDPKKHHRRSIRLKGYDYSQEGLYFVTICVQNNECLFGQIENRKMILNEAGKMVEQEWLKLKERFSKTELHEYVVMPNHFHGIIEIVGAIPCGCPNSENQNCGCPNCGNQNCGCPNRIESQNLSQGNCESHGVGQPQGIAPTESKTLGDIVGAFQSIVTVKYIHGVKKMGWQRFNGKLLQRNYWEHIIRNMESYVNISNYINNNPANWGNDKFFT